MGANRGRSAIGPFDVVDLPQQGALLELFAELDAVLVQPGFRSEAVVFTIEGMDPSRGSQPGHGPSLKLAAQGAAADQNVP